MHLSLVRWSAAPLGLALLACGGDTPAATSVPGPVPVALAMVSGDNQEGKAGDLLDGPFVIRVTDMRGNGVGGVVVHWSLRSGKGVFSAMPLARWLWSDKFVGPTNADGFAAVFFEPRMVGRSTVVAQPDDFGLEGSPVTFAAEATVLVIRLAPTFDCDDATEWHGFRGPDGSTDLTVPAGTPVEWAASCTAHIVSTSEPIDGKPFDSGLLNSGDRFQFVPAVAGTWEFLDKFSLATGTLMVS